MNNLNVRVPPDLGAIALRIRNGDQLAESQLYEALAKGLRCVIGRRLDYGHEVEDTLQDVILIAIQNIRAGQLNNSECVAGYIYGIMRGRISAVIEERGRSRRQHSISTPAVASTLSDQRIDLERDSAHAERLGLVQGVLGSLPNRDHEILRRFYLEEQDQAQICQEMSLSETQFRLFKSRAKAKLAKAGRRKLNNHKAFCIAVA